MQGRIRQRLGLQEYIDDDGRHVTVRRCLQSPGYHEALAQTKYDGVELQNRQHDFKFDPSSDVRYTQSYGDLNAVAFLLVLAGYHDCNLRWKDRPDVEVELPDGSTVHVEAAEVVEPESARLAGVLDYVNVGVAQAFQADESLEKKLVGHGLNFRAWFSDDGKYDRRGIISDILRFVRESDFERMGRVFESIGAEYPHLKHVHGQFGHVPAGASWIPRIQEAAHSFSPESIVSRVIATLQQKRNIGQTYMRRPLWLALYVTDKLGDPQLSLDTVSSLPLNFSPFEKLLIGDQLGTLVYTSQRDSDA